MIDVSIIIPFYNNWLLTHKRMMEIYSYEPVGRCEIVLINDCSTDTEIDGGVGFWQKSVQKHPIRYYKNQENLGFGKSMNKGVREALGEYVILLSNDVEIYTPFVEETVELLLNNKALVGGELLSTNTGWNVIDNKICPYLNGWYLASKKADWLEIGGFDVEFGKFDAEDIDISLRYLEKGYQLLPLKNARLHHLGGQTIYKLYPDRQEYTKKNIEYLRQKWTGKLGFL